jgi:hypothetical protein
MRRSQKAIQTGGTGGGLRPPKEMRRMTSRKHLAPKRTVGAYRPTRKNKNALRRWKQGKSVGFTWISSLKAKGLIPRSNGTKRVSPKYR